MLIINMKKKDASILPVKYYVVLRIGIRATTVMKNNDVEA
jgi:hypothetical protein